MLDDVSPWDMIEKTESMGKGSSMGQAMNADLELTIKNRLFTIESGDDLFGAASPEPGAIPPQ